MNIKKLKLQNPNLNISIVDILSKLDPSDNNKLTPFLIKMYKKKVESFIGEYHNEKRSFTEILENNIKDHIGDAIGWQNLENLVNFNNHLKNNRIENSDVTSYNSWDNVTSELNKAELKLIDKSICKQIEVVFEDDSWLVLKPLSFKASLTYGSNTRWCTAMKNEPSYFYRYSKRGVLVYVINKTNGVKYGFFSCPEEFSVWDQVDNRVDSLTTNLPYELLLTIKDSMDPEKNSNNHSKFDESELKSSEYYLLEKTTAVEPMPIYEVTEEVEQMPMYGEFVEEEYEVRGN